MLRGLVLGGKLAETLADDARRDYAAFTINRHDAQPLAERIWRLRHQFSSYDACYLALAEGLDAPLYTCDAKLQTDGHDADVRLLPTTR